MDTSQAQALPQIQTPTSFPFNNPDNKFKREPPPQKSSPVANINVTAIDMPGKTETLPRPLSGGWKTPTSHGMRQRPATIHEGFSYCVSEGYPGLPSWDSSSISQQQTPSETAMSRPVSMHQDLYPPPPTTESNSWPQKPCEDNLEFHGLDGEMGIGQAYTSDEAIPILDLRYQNGSMEGESLNIEGGGLNPRRMSGSSFTVSEMTSYEDFSTTISEAPSYSSNEYPPPSNRNSLMSSTQLSPVASPRMTPQGRSELVRTQSRGRGASPSPRPGVRSAPYSVDSNRNNKRWSTGSYATMPPRRQSPFVYPQQHQPQPQPQHHDPFGPSINPRHSSPTMQHHLPLNYANLQAAQHNPYFLGPNPAPAYPRHSMLLPSQLPSQLPSHGFHHDPHHFEAPPPLMSHGLFRMLQSNGDPHSLHGHYADLSDPPDLYGSLHEEQLPPPPEDLNPEDPDLVPHEQDLRFEGDLYTPRWVRGHGNKREGWCGICKPGRWLVLKNSAFWYDKSFTHGISAATGSPFQEPQETRRMDGNPDVWEGLCGSCTQWIALVSSKKKGTTWFRHAYKCHTHQKIKDAPKRRRESSHSRALAAANMAKPKVDLMPQHQHNGECHHGPVTPQMPSTASGPASQQPTPPHTLQNPPPHPPPQAPLPPPPPQRHSNAAVQAAAAQIVVNGMPGMI